MARVLTACLVDGCNGIAGAPGSGRGYCTKHYLRWRRHGDPSASKIDREQTGKPCKVEGCGKPSGYKGMCQAHYRRLQVRGDVSDEALHPRYRRIQKWMDAHVSYDGDDCLKWPFNVNNNGRGAATLNGAMMSAPRAMCLLAHGEPPTPEHETAHSCGKGHEGCINPKHLRWATSVENQADKIEHGTIVRGEAVNTAKLTEGDVREIRRIGGTMNRVTIAAMFGVSPYTIYEVQTRRSWAWLA